MVCMERQCKVGGTTELIDTCEGVMVIRSAVKEIE